MPRKSSPSIKHRFEGRYGKKRLIDSLQSQELLAGNISVARKLAEKAVLRYRRANYDLMIQGNSDSDIYFILSGSVSIIINGRKVATRTAGEHIGEMAVADTTALRSATARTLEPTVVAGVTEQDFTRIANRNPDMWRRICVVMARRLRERNKYQTPPRSEPTIFIGSTMEGLDIARAISKSLSRYPYIPRLWSEGVFECSKTTIEELMRIARDTDFAIILLTADDVTKSRGRRRLSPRDNLVFEIGLFMGALTRERTYIMTPKGLDIKIPTDLMGLTRLEFELHPGRTVARCIYPVSKELRKLIDKYGSI